jgi:FkbM family methyltransferase
VCRVPPSSDILNYKQVFGDKQYEPLRALFKYDEPLKILDCGAYVGYASVYLHTIFPNADITAIELDPSNYRVLGFNFHGKKIHGGVWSHDCNLSIGRDFGDKREWSYYAKEEEGTELVVGHSIHKLVGTGIDILKMDIEGGEVEVFKDDSFLERVKVIAIEIHDQLNCKWKVLLSLKKHGFIISESGEITIGRKK